MTEGAQPVEVTNDEAITVKMEQPRAGTAADLSRRMDRMEQRQDKTEATLTSLAVTVERVESNQKHAEELNLLRHDALKGGLDTLIGTVGQFISRFEGILDGTIQTAQTRQSADVLASYITFRDQTIARLDAIEDNVKTNNARVAGRRDFLSWAKVAVITIAPIIAVTLALITFLGKGTP